MLLNDRKLKILEAIINDYIATAEPIGSRTIAKKYGMGISSATIRNEMSDLEELGLIVQPHASSGRVPSDKGYRLYVDTMMRFRELTEAQIQMIHGIARGNITQIDYLMRETARAISILTNYTTIVSEPKLNRSAFRNLQLMEADESSVVLTVLMDDKSIRNFIIDVGATPKKDAMFGISAIFNEYCAGVSIGGLDETASAAILNALGGYRDIGERVLATLKKAFQSEEDVRVYTSGVKNILEFPEFSDIEKAKAIFETFEEKDMLITLLDGGGGGDVQVLIGAENTAPQFKDCTVIKAKYSLGGNNYGQIGIIGPTRMDYPQVLAVLNSIVKNLSHAIMGDGD